MITETEIAQSSRWRTIPDERGGALSNSGLASDTCLYKGFIINRWDYLRYDSTPSFVCFRAAEVPIYEIMHWFVAHGAVFSEGTKHSTKTANKPTVCMEYYGTGADPTGICDLIDLYWSEHSD